MNAEDFNITTWRNLLLSYKHAEAEIDKFMPASRRGGSNTYCGSLIQFPDERIRSARNIRELQGLFPQQVYESEPSSLFTPQDGRVPPAFGNHQFYKNRKLGVFSRQNDYLLHPWVLCLQESDWKIFLSWERNKSCIIN